MSRRTRICAPSVISTPSEATNFRVWLLTIVRNSFLDWVKENRSARLVFLPTNEAAETEPDPQPNVEAMLLERVDSETLNTLVEQLPAEYREVIDPARNRGPFLQGNRRHHRRSTRHRDVAALSRSACIAQGLAGTGAETMNHQRAIALLPAYADRQLGLIRRTLLRRHYRNLPDLPRAAEALQTTRQALRAKLQTHRAPPGLASRIASSLPREPLPLPAPSRRPSRLVWGGGASGLAGALAGVALTLLLTRPADPLVGDVVAGHVRSMMADHLTDVLTSDQHTVKPWLSARLDLSPVVKDLATEGYPLVGGRLDYVEGHRAAALVYRRAKHVINLFAFVAPDTADAPPSLRTRDGFNVITWRMDGLTYVAVSDVEAAQLMTFVHLVQPG